MYAYVMIGGEPTPVNTDLEVEQAQVKLREWKMRSASVWQLPSEPDDDDPNAYANAIPTHLDVFAA